MDRDGHPDLVWQHTQSGEISVWFMNGLALRPAGGQPLGPGQLTDLNWVIAGAGDIDGDGYPHLYWHHRGDGRVSVWRMHGATMVAGEPVGPGQVTDTAWQLRGVGDLDGNGSPDLVWQYVASPFYVAGWLMNGHTLIRGENLNPSPTLPDGAWTVVAPK
jgi:hypothetical protein